MKLQKEFLHLILATILDCCTKVVKYLPAGTLPHVFHRNWPRNAPS